MNELWNKIICDPSASVSVAALVLNIIFFSVTVYANSRSNRKERNFQLKYAIYDQTVIKSYIQLMKSIIEIKRLYQNAIHIEGDNIKEKLLDTLDEIDSQYAEIENTIFPFFAGFSSDLYDEISPIIEDYYDNITNLVSLYSSKDISRTSKQRNINMFSETTSTLIRKIYELTDKYKVSA